MSDERRTGRSETRQSMSGQRGSRQYTNSQRANSQRAAGQRVVSQRNAEQREAARRAAAQKAGRRNSAQRAVDARTAATRERRNVRRRRKSTWMTLLPAGIALVLLIAIAIPVIWSMRSEPGENTNSGDATEGVVAIETTTPEAVDVEQTLAEAELLAKQYNYAKAIKKIDKLLKTDPENEDWLGLKVKYTRQKSKLVAYTGEVRHVFFHQLIVDPSITFGNQNSEAEWAANNSVMTTLDEFNKMLPQLYKNGYVLVYFDQLYDVEKDKNGEVKLTKKTLMLPEGKKPLIISQDDVNFYQKTTLKWGGYGQKFVLDENGDVKVLYIDDKGKESVGDYDLVPALDTFLDEHPDFSYQGAKAYVGLTGYDGVLGYRVNIDQKDSETYAADCETVKQIADAMKKDGWQFASHSYSHGHMSTQTVAEIKEDAKWWEEQVANLVGKTNVYLFPYGDWGQYDQSTAEAKMKVLQKAGFVFMNGVGAYDYSKEYEQYFFMDRCNLDGQCMYNRKELLSQYFDVDSVWDKRRPDVGLSY